MKNERPLFLLYYQKLINPILANILKINIMTS